jgi:hypothetical protein
MRQLLHQRRRTPKRRRAGQPCCVRGGRPAGASTVAGGPVGAPDDAARPDGSVSTVGNLAFVIGGRAAVRRCAGRRLSAGVVCEARRFAFVVRRRAAVRLLRRLLGRSMPLPAGPLVARRRVPVLAGGSSTRWRAQGRRGISDMPPRLCDRRAGRRGDHNGPSQTAGDPMMLQHVVLLGPIRVAGWRATNLRAATTDHIGRPAYPASCGCLSSTSSGPHGRRPRSVACGSGHPELAPKEAVAHRATTLTEGEGFEPSGRG